MVLTVVTTLPTVVDATVFVIVARVELVTVVVVVVVGRVCCEIVLTDVTIEETVMTAGVTVVFSVLALAVDTKLAVTVLLIVV